MDDRLILALDQGTTGSTALLVTTELEVLARANVEFPQIYPKPGWVEHNPDAIWESVQQSIANVLVKVPDAKHRIAAIGITNQRETTVVWDRQSGQPIHNAIVWQCRRTAERTAALRAKGLGPVFKERTGLVLDPYFSGTKIAWQLDHVDGARARAERGELVFGTIDTFLVWKLTAGARLVTDASNASRTLLYNIHEGCWDEELANHLSVPTSVLPEVVSCSEYYGETHNMAVLPDGIPVCGMAGDQQSALFGQACFEPGDAKCTYGTGAFLLQNTGEEAVTSNFGLLTTVAWKLGDTTTYALEGSVFIAGAAVQWLRDGLQLIQSAPEIEALASSVSSSDGVVVVPAFVGLGAPYWDSEARGAVLGVTRGTTRAHVARATLDGIALSCADLAVAMAQDSGRTLPALRVDGGAAENNLLMQTQSDLLGTEVIRPRQLETTALGAACLAGLSVGIFEGLEDIRSRWQTEQTFQPAADCTYVEPLKDRWKRSVEAVRSLGC
ncbi:MAG: glycerol kinase [Myxococcales bacterium]|nr:glycerol kinase [Myxococcales bacterium]